MLQSLMDKLYKKYVELSQGKIDVAALKERLDVKNLVSEGYTYHTPTDHSRENNKSIMVGILYNQETNYNMIYSVYNAFEHVGGGNGEYCPVIILQSKGYSNRYSAMQKQMIEHDMRYEFDFNCTDTKFDILIVHQINLPPTSEVKQIIDNSKLRVAVYIGVINYTNSPIPLEWIRQYEVTDICVEQSIYDAMPADILNQYYFHVTGNPKFDCIYKAYQKDIEIPEHFRKLQSDSIKKIILWTTDHNPNSLICTSEVSFDLYAGTVFEYMRKHKDIGLIFRPYRTYINELIRDRLWTKEDADCLMKYCDESENIVWDDENDYSVSYSMADAIMADVRCGIIVSALPMRKPMAIPLRWDMDTRKHILRNKEVLSSYYLISSEQQMLDFIRMVEAGEDSKYQQRMKLIPKYVTNFDGKNGERIRDICINRSKTE